MRRVSFKAMGTTVDVVLDGGGSVSAVQDLFARIETSCSRFLEYSELSLLNRTPSSTVEVSAEMAEVLQVADQLRTRTGGLVDIGVGGAVRRWGYDRTFTEVQDTPDAPSETGTTEWTVDGRNLYRPARTELDLGGVAKGWACDLAVERGLAVIVSAGGDVRSATPAARVEVLDPWGNPVAAVSPGVGGLATSSVTRRRWQAGNGVAHHIIDPRTLAPAVSPILAATVTAPTAAAAEAGAKAVLLMGDRGLAWAEEQSWLSGALIVWHDGSVFATTSLDLAA